MHVLTRALLCLPPASIILVSPFAQLKKSNTERSSSFVSYFFTRFIGVCVHSDAQTVRQKLSWTHSLETTIVSGQQQQHQQQQGNKGRDKGGDRSRCFVNTNNDKAQWCGNKVILRGRHFESNRFRKLRLDDSKLLPL